MRRIAAGLAGLGLIGGAGAVTYNHGTPTVTVNDHGRKEKVTLPMDHGKSYSCPADIDSKLSPHDLTAGRIKLTLDGVRAQERKIELRYPSHTAPKTTADRYNGLIIWDRALVKSFNHEVDARNAIIDSECTPS
jgi:hypothetical protein